MRHLMHKKDKWPVQGHTSHRWWSRHQNQVNLFRPPIAWSLNPWETVVYFVFLISTLLRCNVIQYKLLLLGVRVHEFWQIHMVCAQHYSQGTGPFHHPCPSTPLAPGRDWYVCHHIVVFPALKFHVNVGSMLFSAWLLFLSIMFLRFIQALAHTSNSFLSE